jgi:FkbM family methyltransferase
MEEAMPYPTFSVHFETQSFQMAVRNEQDEIQRFHRRGQFYEVEELALMRSLFPPEAVVVDVGANVGNHSVFFAGVCKAQRVLAFEVNPSAIELLKENVRLNRLDAIDLTYLGRAATDRVRRFEIVDDAPDNLGGAHLVEDRTGQIVSTTLDTALTDVNIDFLKIDVEGMEIKALRGARRTIRRCRPPIFVEVMRSNLRKFYSLVRKFGYRIERTICRYFDVYNFLIWPNY